MGFFTSNKRVTPREIKDVRSSLRAKGFSDADIRNINKMTSGHMGEEGIYKGMDRKELERMMKDVERHPSWHTFSDEQKKQLKEALEKKL